MVRVFLLVHDRGAPGVPETRGGAASSSWGGGQCRGIGHEMASVKGALATGNRSARSCLAR